MMVLDSNKGSPKLLQSIMMRACIGIEIFESGPKSGEQTVSSLQPVLENVASASH